jgi:beta-glucanase (GH16 family)
VTYTFDDNFNSLGSVWLRHFHCCGVLAGYDAALTSVSSGVLSMSVDHRTTGWYSDLIDTKTTWTQKYGYFEARIKVPKGPGLWPAFWSYYSNSGYEAEIDPMEVCANPIGMNGGNDASLLHTNIHWASGGTAGDTTRTQDLSLAYHVYAYDWRADHIAFYLDGVQVWRYTDTAHIPTVALPLILNLGVGGSWCGSPTSATPDGATMLVDWVRVRP